MEILPFIKAQAMETAMTSRTDTKRLASAERRLKEIEKALREYLSPIRGKDYVSRGDWLPTDSNIARRREADRARGVSRHSN